MMFKHLTCRPSRHASRSSLCFAFSIRSPVRLGTPLIAHRVGAQTAEEERVCRVRTRSLVSHVPRPTAPGAGAARPQPPCMQPQLRCCRTAPVVALTRDRRGCAGRAPRRSDEAHRARREAALGRTSPPCERALTRRGVPCAAPGRSPCAWSRPSAGSPTGWQPPARAWRCAYL